MSFEAEGRAAGSPPGRACPFCGARAEARVCPSCGRDTTAPRRPCRSCGRMVPSAERLCWNCGAAHRGDMWWKIPLIVFLFLLAFVLSIVLAALK